MLCEAQEHMRFDTPNNDAAAAKMEIFHQAFFFKSKLTDEFEIKQEHLSAIEDPPSLAIFLSKHIKKNKLRSLSSWYFGPAYRWVVVL